MWQRLKHIGIGLAVVHMVTYVFLSDWMMERKVCAKYLQFTEHRFANPYNKNINETILVSSCGYEFFRDPHQLTTVARSSNPDHPPETIDEWDQAFEEDFVQSVYFRAYPSNVLDEIYRFTDTLETKNCIVYEVCSIREMPFLFKRVNYRYTYSSEPIDFHIMRYTGRALGSEPYYIWLLFTWVEFRGQIGNYL